MQVVSRARANETFRILISKADFFFTCNCIKNNDLYAISLSCVLFSLSVCHDLALAMGAGAGANVIVSRLLVRSRFDSFISLTIIE